MVTSQCGIPLPRRYTRADLRALTSEEARRFLRGDGCDPQADTALAWELLYRLEPDLYDRLIRAEPLHPAILDWLPRRARTIVEVGAGTGRLTAALIDRCDHLIAIEPAAALRRRLAARLGHQAGGRRLDVLYGFFDRVPVPDRSADLVIACSALTPDAAHGGDAGLVEMERVCAAGGQVVVVWPNHPGWLAARGYQYQVFPGPMRMEFESLDEAIELAEIFFPHASAEIRRRGDRRVPYDVLGVNPPCDLAYKEIAA
jgi:SAM-dependent methyltransferase